MKKFWWKSKKFNYYVLYNLTKNRKKRQQDVTQKVFKITLWKKKSE